jgi:hypothetical protein
MAIAIIPGHLKEDPMFDHRSIAVTMKSLMLAGSFVTLAAAAPAMADTDSATSCRTLAQQTRAALSNASGDVTEAKTESSAGMQACNFGLWQNGSAHYRKALTLLGK